MSFSKKTNTMTNFSKNGFKEKTEFTSIGYEEEGEYKYRKRQSCTAGIINNLKPIDIKTWGK